MNERIKELEVQCWDDIAPEWAENVRMVFNIEKFAELIVRECAELTLDHKNDDYYAGWLDYRDEILKHFGVRE